jgi:hypothetical protein
VPYFLVTVTVLKNCANRSAPRNVSGMARCSSKAPARYGTSQRLQASGRRTQGNSDAANLDAICVTTHVHLLVAAAGSRPMGCVGCGSKTRSSSLPPAKLAAR